MDQTKVWRGLLSLPTERHPRLRCFKAAKESRSLLQRLKLLHTLDVHRGCVNSIVWNETGEYILSGSDDHRLIVTEPYTKRVLVDQTTSHRANIFSAKFLSGTSNEKVISCAGDGTILYTDLNRVEATNGCTFTCHSGTAYQILTVPGESNNFFSCGEDGSVRWFDLRTKDRCEKSDCKEDILISMEYAVTALSLNSLLPYYLAVGSSDSCVRVFDRRMLGAKPQMAYNALCSRFCLPHMEGKRRRITSVDYRPDGREVLVSFSSEFIYTFDPMQPDASHSKRLFVGRPPQGLNRSGRVRQQSPPSLKRLRLRGDWSDTGPQARPEGSSGHEREATSPGRESTSALMQRMTEALSRMLTSPSYRNRLRNMAEAGLTPEVSDIEENDDEAENSAVEASPAAVTSQSNEVTYQPTPNRSATEASVDSLRESVTEMRQDFISRHNVEPDVNLLYRPLGMQNSEISMRPSQNPPRLLSMRYASQMLASRAALLSRTLPSQVEAAESPTRSPLADSLPGPSQVVTHPGNSSTGTIEFPSGISGLASVSQSSQENATDDVQEYEIDIQSFNDEGVGREIPQPKCSQKFVGHRNARTMIKEATWWGNDFILSGSDCGHILGWERSSGRLVVVLEADRHVVNCVQPHPFDPVLISSGIDYNIKLWTPTKFEPDFDEEAAEALCKRNRLMLEETMDTITVPATLMIRMLASLSQFRRARRPDPAEDDGDEQQEDTV